MKLWPWLLGGAVVTAAVVGGRASASDNYDPGESDMTAGRDQFLYELSLIPELSEIQRIWADITAKGESNYRPNAHNESTSEVAASVNATTPAIVARAAACGVSQDKLQTGSWGRYQRLAPYLANDAWEIWGADGCGMMDPTRTSRAFQHVSAFETAHDLQQYRGFKVAPTLGNLRLGWWGPGQMGYLTRNASRLDKYRKVAVGLGYPASVIDAPIGPFPRNLRAIYARLAAAGLA